MPATSFSNLITFSRGTNATVTDSTGRLTYAPHNLATFSEQFDNSAWTKTAAGTGVTPTVTANAGVAPDGTTTADQIVFNRGAGNTISDRSYVFQSPTVVSGVSYASSVYLKAATPSDAGKQLSLRGVAGAGYTIITLTNAWQRVSSVELAGSTTGNLEIANRGTITSSNSVTALVWGAQMEAVTYQTTPSTYYPTTVKNLLGYSQDFSNAGWSKTRAVIAGCPFVNPVDGLFTANKLMVDATATATHSVSQDFSLGASVPVTASIYVKAAEYTTGRLVLTALSGSFPEIVAIFDLTAATVTTSSSGGTTVLGSSITPLSNGWYRVSISGFTGLSGNHRFWVYPNTNSTFTGDGNSGIYIYGAQLSDSASLDPYVPTPAAAPSSTAYYGPRFDYDPVTLAPKGLLVEEARTNLLTYSADFTNAAWTLDNSGATNPVVTANQATAPDGTLTADRIVFNKTGGTYSRIQQSTLGASATYTFSVWMRTTSGTGTANVGLRMDTYGANCAVTGTWTRFTFTSPVAITNPAGQILLFDSIPGNDETADVLVWGAQIEAGAFATSYIPTVASSVTRSADVATITGSLFSGWYRQDEGTFVAQFDDTSVGASYFTNIYRVDDGTANNRMALYRNASPTSVGFDVTTGGVSQVNAVTATASIANPTKHAATYKANDFAASVNGGTVATDTSGTVPSGISVLRLGRDTIGSTTTILNGHIRSIQYIPNATSASQLQAATS